MKIISIGDRVKITAGKFAGRVGTVDAIDDKVHRRGTGLNQKVVHVDSSRIEFTVAGAKKRMWFADSKLEVLVKFNPDDMVQ